MKIDRLLDDGARPFSTRVASCVPGASVTVSAPAPGAAGAGAMVVVVVVVEAGVVAMRAAFPSWYRSCQSIVSRMEHPFPYGLGSTW